MNILDEIIAEKRKEIALSKAQKSISDLEKEKGFSRQTFSLKNSLKHSSSGIISEFKRKSPSKGWIHQNASVVEVTKGYSNNGASGVSILTDYSFFGGTKEDLMVARCGVSVPILRKDFIVDEYQLFEARAMGADVILLIAAVLTSQQVKQLAIKAHDLSLEVLLEVHNEQELAYVCENIDIVGVNNRNLKNFVVDMQMSFLLADKISTDFVKISESGISNPQVVKDLQAVGYQGFLMGENFMKEENPAKALQQFISLVENK